MLRKRLKKYEKDIVEIKETNKAGVAFLNAEYDILMNKYEADTTELRK